MKRSANKCELMLLTETKRSHTIPLVTSKSVIKKPKGKGDIIMKELNNNPEVTDVCNEKTACLCDSNERTPFSRLAEEKRALDEKIVKLNAFLKDEEKAGKIAGHWQLEQMREQLDVMLRYSCILNTRILTWRHN